ncbi:MAG: hypothetical protein CMP07_04730 [Xanthomonadales bacterium]|nr:hypothetical protein [Xanthomonadales bacterium]
MNEAPGGLHSSLESGGIDNRSTGIRGLDERLGGGLPAGRTTLVAGGPGAGKTLLTVQAPDEKVRYMGARRIAFDAIDVVLAKRGNLRFAHSAVVRVIDRAENQRPKLRVALDPDVARFFGNPTRDEPLVDLRKRTEGARS